MVKTIISRIILTSLVQIVFTETVTAAPKTLTRMTSRISSASQCQHLKIAFTTELQQVTVGQLLNSCARLHTRNFRYGPTKLRE